MIVVKTEGGASKVSMTGSAMDLTEELTCVLRAFRENVAGISNIEYADHLADEAIRLSRMSDKEVEKEIAEAMKDFSKAVTATFAKSMKEK